MKNLTEPNNETHLLRPRCIAVINLYMEAVEFKYFSAKAL